MGVVVEACHSSCGHRRGSDGVRQVNDADECAGGGTGRASPTSVPTHDPALGRADGLGVVSAGCFLHLLASRYALLEALQVGDELRQTVERHANVAAVLSPLPAKGTHTSASQIDDTEGQGTVTWCSI